MSGEFPVEWGRLRREECRCAGRKSVLSCRSRRGRLSRCAQVGEYREILAKQAGFQSIEVIIARGRDDASSNGQPKDGQIAGGLEEIATQVTALASEWPALVRAGLGAASGEHLVVLDVSRHYSPEALVRVIEPVRGRQFDLAVAVPHPGRSSLARWVRSRLGIGLVSRLLLGTSDVFSGLFALSRSIWDAEAGQVPRHGSSLVIDSLLRRRARCIDVPVAVDARFRTGRLGFQDLRPLKHLLDGRFGNYSRLVQFCIVGASGMVVDLSFYALLQFLLSFTWLAAQVGALRLLVAPGNCRSNVDRDRPRLELHTESALDLQRRRKGALVRQFFTYVFSNALAIALSFSVRLYLPAHVGFFARHRLAAAVVGIVAATGVSFSMSRWLVFAKRPELKRATHFPLEPSAVGQPTSVP